MSRRWRNLPSRRGKYWTGYQSSPVPAVPPPQFLRPAGTLRFAARLLPSARRRFDPPWPPPAILPPLRFIRPAGPQRTPARLLPSQRRRFDPGWTPQPAAVFTLGEPYFQWATGTPYLS